MSSESTAPFAALPIEQQRLLLARLLEKKAARRREFPASYPQEGLWFLHQLDPSSTAYNIPMALSLAGRLRRDLLEKSLREIVRRHWTMRTSLVASGKGVVQVVVPVVEIHLAVQDLASLPEAERDREVRCRIGEVAERPFDLTRAPLFRAGLLRLGAEEHVVYLVVHHAIFDGWSMGVLVRELAALYRAFSQGDPTPLPALPLQYVDFAEWQRERMEKGSLEPQLAYWRGRLLPLPEPLELPADRPRPARRSSQGAACAVDLPADLSAALADLGRRNGASLFMTLLAGLYALLSRYTGQRDLTIGSPIANRNRSEVEGLIGFFVNTLVLRIQAGASEGFRGWLEEARLVAFEAFAHQDLPFEKLVEDLRPERDLSRSPLFQAMFVLQNAPLPPIVLPGVTLSVLDLARTTARFDLLLELGETAAGLRGRLEYSTDLFEETTATRVARLFGNLLAGIVAAPERPLADLPLLGASERSQVVAQWNDTAADLPQGLSLHHLFETQVERSPDSVAVLFEGRSLTYRVLDRESNRLACWLRSQGVGPEIVVGVLLDRSLEMVVALLGVLKAGGAYLPLDPSYPKERRDFFVADAAPRLVLTVSGLADLVPAGSRAVFLDTDGPEIAAAGRHRPAALVGPESLAYVIYTSGSTGRPKGVMNAHRGVVNRILWIAAAYGLAPGARLLQKTPMSFDVSVGEIFWPLAAGACLVLARPGGHRDPAYLIDVIVREEITNVHFVPSMLRAFLAAPGVERCVSVRRLLASGEELPAEVACRLLDRLAGAELHNLYGPTEAAVEVTAWTCRREEAVASVPIGRPIANLNIHLLDPAGQPVPIGVPGELHIGGVGVGRGYLGRPERTAERFVPDPWSPGPGGRLYRTGDLARHQPDGAIVFLRRIDHQVKIRGFRVELGEIEHALRSLPGVLQAAVAVQNVQGEPLLVAYFVLESGELPVARLREALRERLPDAMIPAAWVKLEALPLSAHGKVDRKALPAPAGIGGSANLVAPRTYLEDLVAGAWAQVLGIDLLSVEENVFDIGAHSLLATQVLSRLNRELGIDLPLRRLFELPTVALLAAEIEALRRGTAAGQVPPLRSVPRDGPLPLSFSQRRIWFFDRFEPESAVFNLPTAVRLEGELSIPALTTSLNAVVRRHEILRTCFSDVLGEPIQVIQPFLPRAFPLADLAALPERERRTESERLVREAALLPFNLELGPLFRAVLLRHTTREHVAVLTLHHIAADGWSLRLLTREISAVYAASAAGRPSLLPELPIQFVDYAAWQWQWLEGEILARELAFWKERLAGAPGSIDLPLDRPRRAAQRYRGRRRSAFLPRELAAALRGISRAAGGTLFMVLVTAWKALLLRCSNRTDLAIGTLIANRNHRELESLIGFFVNALVLRTVLPEDLTLRQALGRVRETTLDAYAHQDLPFEKLVEELSPERHLGQTPLFQVMFVLQNTPAAALDLPGLRLTSSEVERDTVNYDLYWTLEEGADGILVQLDYDVDLFDDATIGRLLGQFAAMARAVASDPERRLVDVPLLNEAERQHLLVEWNDAERPSVPGAAATFYELFAAEAQRRPGALAAVCGAGRLTYGDLCLRVERAARNLAGLGFGQGDLAALLADRSLDFLTMTLALFRCGGAYLPLDPSHPDLRLAQILAASRPALALVSADAAARLESAVGGMASADRPRLLRLETLLAEEPRAVALPACALPGDLAYVIYTSGSTGAPKGVMVEQEGMRNHLWAKIETLALTARDIVVQNASQCFDISVWQLFAALAVGGVVRIVADAIAHEPWSLLEEVDRGECTVLEVVPSMLRAVLDEIEGLAAARPPLPRLRFIVATGEALPADLCARWLALYPDVPLLNAYGPTECSDDVSHLLVRVPSEAGQRSAPIGRPLRNTRLYVLDPRQRPVPIGVPGELSVGGAGLGRGYLFDPARTARSFIPDGLSGAFGARLYRTGDHARLLADGRIEFLGRLDQQVKVRGFRIESGEIEALLRVHPDVGEAVVVARQGGPGGTSLLAYVTAPAGRPSSGSGLSEALRVFLAERLPDYMIPALFVLLDRLPLTPNGKIDYRSLPEPELTPGDGAGRATPPRTRTERALAEIWREVLGTERIAAEDSFFALGGHSLLATRVMSRLQATLGVALPLRDLFEAPSLAALAARVDRALGTAVDLSALPILPAPAKEEWLSFAQERLWFLDQLDPGNPAYNLPLAVLAIGETAPAVFVRVVNEIVRRHAALRTTFRAVAGRPRQILHLHSTIELPEVDLCAIPPSAAQAETIRWAVLDARRPFDLERGPLVRTMLLKRGPQERVLLLNIHHIVSDGWSMGVFLAEVATLYPAFAAGRPSPLAELAIQYTDYARWQRELLQGEILGRQLAYWKEQLAGAPEALDLAGRGSRPVSLRASHGGTHWFRLPSALSQRLRVCSRQQGTTPFMTLLAGFAAALHRYTGASDLMIGVPLASRGRIELEPLIGFFVNTLVVRVELPGSVGGEELLRRVRRVTLDAFTHQDLPFEKLVAELNPGRDLDRSPLFQVMLALQNAPAERIALPGLELHRLEIETGTTRFELFLELSENGDELEGALHFSRDLFDPLFITRFAAHFLGLLQGLAAEPGREVGSLPLLAAAERAQLVREWNDSASEISRDLPFHELFARCAARYPDRVAARADGEHLTYAALAGRADAIAACLLERGIAEESVVALLAERGLTFLSAVLGVFKAGAAYLPLDPHHPASRLRQILAQSRSLLVMAMPALAPLASEALAGLAAPVLLALDSPTAGASCGEAPARGGAEHLAYVIFTSGSTGIPKGAMLVHRGMVNHLSAKIVELGLTASDVVAQTASQCFDISIWQFLAPLVVGGRVEIYADAVAHDPAALLDRVEADGVTVLETVPSLLRLMLAEIGRRRGPVPALSSLGWLIPTGEALPADLCRDWYGAYPRKPLLNAYGPTECSDDVSHYRVPAAVAAEARSIAIGRPVLNTQLYVMDAGFHSVPLGVVGELCVGGRGVGRGYLLDPGRTAASFVPDPCSGDSGARLYRTGDLARYRADGNLDFLGRLDHQVKIRGFRLELGEIEAILGEHPALSVAVVLAGPEASGAQRLVAYVVPRPGSAPEPQELREYLKSRLPEYAIPAAWVTLASLPLTPAGKVDRRSLPDVERGAAGTDRPYVAPRTEVEATVAAVFAEVIGLPRVGALDNFFDLGGHSLLTTQATWRLNESFGVELALRALFEAPTVAELAGAIEALIIEQIDSLSDDEVDSLLDPEESVAGG